METSQTIGKISEALAKAQGQMKPAVYDLTNPHFRSKYASLASIMEACRSALSANGIAIIQGTSVETEPLRVNVTTILTHLSGEWFKETLSIRPAKDDAQGIGSSITYARRYGLSALVGIVADEDDDAETAVGRPTTVPSPKPVLTTVKKVAAQPKVTNPEKVATNKNDSPQVDPTKVETSKPTVMAPANSKPVTTPAKPATVVRPPANGNGRVAKVRIIFTLSSQLGHSPEQMKSAIGAHLGLNRPIKESSEIPNDQLDRIISSFQQELANQNQPRKEAA
jgi:hypothetical protein